jgi:hypothetical protein
MSNRRVRTIMSHTVVEHYTIHGCFSAPKLGGKPPGTILSGRIQFGGNIDVFSLRGAPA